MKITIPDDFVKAEIIEQALKKQKLEIKKAFESWFMNSTLPIEEFIKRYFE